MLSMPADAVAIEDDGPWLRATVRLPGHTSEQLLSAFTDPAQLARWWGGELHTDLVIGGPYTVRFPALDRSMTGQVVGYEPARSLAFTWSWDGSPGEPRRTVTVRASAAEPAALTIEHGPHGDGDDERVARAEHRAGWEHFLPRLVSVLGG
jgi:uncharacterized protein YndB with AHSA1/START domain